jgi:S-DNA-T family DNA segregation ATPase FtsK/SpoIIIE
MEIPAPPPVEQERTPGWLMTILPMMSILFMGGFYLLIAAVNPSAGSRSWLMALPMVGIGFLTIIVSLVVSSTQRYEQKMQRIRQTRDYQRLLDKKEARLLAGNSLQFDWMMQNFPDPATLIRMVQDLDLRIWERRPEDADFMAVRLGRGRAPGLIKIQAPDPDVDSAFIRRAFGIYTHYRELPNAPVVVSLQEARTIGVVGPRDQTLPMVYSLLMQLVAFHAPEDLRLYILAPEQHYKQWQWARWLPHVSDSIAGGKPTFMAFGMEAERGLLSALSKQMDERRDTNDQAKKTDITSGPFSLLVFDQYADVKDEAGFNLLLRESRSLRSATLVLCDTLEDVPSDCQAVLEVNQRSFRFSRTGVRFPEAEFPLSEFPVQRGIPDLQSEAKADNLARRLRPIVQRTSNQSSRIPSSVNLLGVYGINRVENFDLPKLWSRIPREGILPYPIQIGMESYVQPLSINLAENQDGPHGIIAGTTGSGKSELLQSLVAALALEHHPYYVNFLLIDFKGKSTFGIFEKLPHTVGMVSNLDKAGAQRALEAIRAENLRRQQVLAKKGLEDVTAYYQEISRMGSLPPSWEPLPHLFIIVDEFAELVKDMPDFLKELVATVRVGRSLGLHLILATQRPAGVVTDDMRANLNFRISLRVQTMDDSRDMLRRPDAAFIPSHQPGRAYFQIGDGGVARQFQCARVGVEYIPMEQEEVSSAENSTRAKLVYWLDGEQKTLISEPQKKESRDKKPTLLSELMIEQMCTYWAILKQQGYQQPQQILLEPLPNPNEVVLSKRLLLPQVMEKVHVSWRAEQGRWEQVSGENYYIPVGRIDDLANRAQPPLLIDLSAKGGHWLVIGAQAMGKTFFLRSLVLSATQCLPPSLLHVYIISFAGKSLDPLMDLPHVGDVVHSNEQERLGRLLRFLREQLELRKNQLAVERKDEWFEYNQAMLAKDATPLPLLLVLIDNFAELRDTSYEAELGEVEKIMRDGRAYGIYFIVTALQSSAIPFKLMNLLDHRMVLYMTEKNEYAMILGRSGLDVEPLPGRGLLNTIPPTQFQIAAPLSELGEDYVGELSSSFAGAARSYLLPSKIRTLPTRINLSDLSCDLRAPAELGLPVLVGREGLHLDPLWLDLLETGSSCLVSGPSGSGRTSLLHTLVLSAVSCYSPDQLRIVLFDGSQGSLEGLKNLPHVLDWVIDEDRFKFNVLCLKKELQRRKQELGPERNDGRFPHLLFVVDDYDMTREAYNIPDELLQQLGRFIRQERRHGFGMWLSGIPQSFSSGDPLIKAMKLGRSGIALATGDAVESVGGRATSAMHRDNLIEGRGYLVLRGSAQMAQFAYPDEAMRKAVRDKWRSYSNVVWELLPEDQDLSFQESDRKERSSTSLTGSWEDFFDVSMDDLTREYSDLRKQQSDNQEKG